MHNPVAGSSDMNGENTHHMPSQDSTYGAAGEHWGPDMSPYQNHSTSMADYGSFYAPNIAPMLSPSAHLPSESLARMPPLPPSSHHDPAHLPSMHHATALPATHPPQLTMLITPGVAQWPSMITNPVSADGSSYSAPPIAMGSVVQPPPPTSRPTKAVKPGRSGSQPRRTLTNEERRGICLFRAENPSMKQSDIGAKFNIERSTVSKVLRDKDKYLCPQDSRSTSPIKKTKGKFPDIERALSNWVRNQRRNGKEITDDLIKEKAQQFAASVGNSNPLKVVNSSWLQRFKQKNNIGPGRLLRRASEANIPDSAQLASVSMAKEDSQQSNSPLSHTNSRSENDKESPMEKMLPFEINSDNIPNHRQPDGISSGPSSAIESNNYKHLGQNNSTTPLQTSFTDAPTPITSASVYSGLSDSNPFTFSPDPSSTAAFPDPNFQRPRSQTFPNLEIQFESMEQTGREGPGSNYIPTPPSTAPPSALTSTGEMGNFATLDPNISSPLQQPISHVLHRAASSGSLRARNTTSTSPLIGGSHPSSPTQEDAFRAAETLLSFLKSQDHGPGSPVDQIDLENLQRLTEKLRFPNQHNMLSTRSTLASSALTRIPENEVDMTGTKSEPLNR